MQGRIRGISGHTVMLELDSIIDFPLDEIVDVEIKKHREKRSLNANNYFHKLCDELRKKLGISLAACKNDLITSYGQIEYVDDTPLTYGTKAPPEYVRELLEIHMKLFRAEPDGWNWYVVYRGSHTYDSQEMAKLIDGTVEECKLQGIETMTPNELARLEGYEKQSSRRY